jgi:Zn-finger nucleic acid-binding protein
MRCPSCKGNTLDPSLLDGLFRAHICSDCGGNWFLIEDYVVWKERNPEFAFSKDASFESEDTKNALLCPVTGKIMQKYRFAQDSDHRLDFSPGIGGVWLDAGEWEYLKEQNLAGSLNRIFTAQWQRMLREKNAEVAFADLYQARFGEASYAKAREVREWLNDHSCKAELIAYILAENPYSAEK